MKRFFFIILFLAVVLANQILHAGVWTQQRGEGYYKLGLRIVRADEFYEPGGNKISIRTVGEYTTIFYGEHGLSDRFTVVVSAPIVKRITLNRQVGTGGALLFEGHSKTGVADFDLGVRVGLLRTGSAVVSAEALFGIPFGDDEQEIGLYTGDGEFNQVLKLQFGYSFSPLPIFFSSEAGFNNRSNGYSDEFHYSAEVGYTFKNKFLLIFRLRGVESLKNENDPTVGGSFGLFANNQRYLSYGPEINFLINRSVGFVAGIEGATRAENVLSAPAFSFGFFLKR